MIPRGAESADNTGVILCWKMQLVLLLTAEDYSTSASGSHLSCNAPFYCCNECEGLDDYAIECHENKQTTIDT